MANIMTTYVKVKNLNEETIQNFKSLFETENSDSSYVNIVNHLNKVYGTNLTEFDRDWMVENVGSKWLTIEFDGSEITTEVDLIIESAYSVPTEYLQSLVNYLYQENNDVVLYGTYEDESYNPIGAFVFAFDYDDIEDYDDLDPEKMWEDDDYREEIYDQLYEHRDSLYEGYLEVLKEREEDDSF